MHFSRFALGFVFLSLGSGCHGGETKGRRDFVLTPLASAKLSLPRHVKVFEPIGATETRPVYLALTNDSVSCDDWAKRIGKRPFFVCSFAAGEEAASEVRSALKELKKAYSLHVSKPPVRLLVDEGRLNEGLALIAEEPAFFATVMIRAAHLDAVSATRVSSFGQGGGKRLILVSNDQSAASRVRAASRPTGILLSIHPSDEVGRAEAVGEFSSP